MEQQHQRQKSDVPELRLVVTERNGVYEFHLFMGDRSVDPSPPVVGRLDGRYAVPYMSPAFMCARLTSVVSVLVENYPSYLFNETEAKHAGRKVWYSFTENWPSREFWGGKSTDHHMLELKFAPVRSEKSGTKYLKLLVGGSIYTQEEEEKQRNQSGLCSLQRRERRDRIIAPFGGPQAVMDRLAELLNSPANAISSHGSEAAWPAWPVRIMLGDLRWLFELAKGEVERQRQQQQQEESDANNNGK